jgi:hypothetical protein
MSGATSDTARLLDELRAQVEALRERVAHLERHADHLERDVDTLWHKAARRNEFAGVDR